MPNIFNRKRGGAKSRDVNIKREYYTMSTTVEGDEAEIIMYGDIVQETPRDWWTDEPLEGNYIVLDDFMNDLDLLADVAKLTVRLNSCGGDAYAAIPIHNRLRELKAEVTAVVDGVAMSGGSLIMCAADKVRVNPSSLIMIHKCWLLLIGGYNADELRKIAASNDAVDKAQAAIYKRKTGMDEADILAMMAEETYMTGGEALEKGFADELLEGDPVNIAASADRSTLFVNGSARRLPYPLTGLPESIPTVNPEAAGTASVSTNNNQPATTGGKPSTDDYEGGKSMATTPEELRVENPELFNAMMAEARAVASVEIGSVSAAAETERKRIKEIDEVSALFDDETVREAKYGENPCTAQEMTYRAAQKAAKQGKRFMSEMADDAENSGANDVGAAPAPEDNPDGGESTPEKEMNEARTQVSGLLGKTKKEV